MKQIIFIRHAKVDMDSTKKVYAKTLKTWEEEYNNAPIVITLPNEELIGKIKSADYIISSTLRRSIDSLVLVDVDINETNVLFNEAAIPALNGSLFKMKPTHWLVLFRILSLLHVGRWAQTLKTTKEDARRASLRLLELSKEHDKIVLMGHGVMNWLIRKELEKRGWKSEGKEAHGNWGATSLVFAT